MTPLLTRIRADLCCQSLVAEAAHELWRAVFITLPFIAICVVLM